MFKYIQKFSHGIRVIANLVESPARRLKNLGCRKQQQQQASQQQRDAEAAQSHPEGRRSNLRCVEAALVCSRRGQLG